MKDFQTDTAGNPGARFLILLMAGEHDGDQAGKMLSLVRALSGEEDVCLRTVRVHSWNEDLSPWPAPAVFGDEDFGDGAAKLLDFLLAEAVPEQAGDRRVLLGGYSLAGLFALWAGYQTDRFSGIAAASPSVWFPRFTDYMRENTIRADAVYLSLGDKEEKTRHPVMRQVGNAVREAEQILKAAGKDCTLEWNRGNHFREPDVRTAKGFAWLIGREKS